MNVKRQSLSLSMGVDVLGRHIQTLQKEDDQSKMICESFCKAFDAAKYAEAIQWFCEFRKLFGAQDDKSFEKLPV